MSHIFEIQIETSAGTTDAAAATLVDLLTWNECVIGFHRRAPAEVRIRIPRDGTHRPTEFIAGRELRVKRNGAHWLAGFMNAPSIPGGSAGREIVLPGWGNAYALTLSHNTPYPGTFGVTLGATWNANGGLGVILDQAEHFPGTDWFPAAGRTIGTAGTSFATDRTFSGLSALEMALQLADIEGWGVRFGINASGVFTVNASPTAVTDLTSTIHLFDGAPGCTLVDYQQDGHALVSQVQVLCRTPNVRTQLNGALGAGATTMTVDSTVGLQTGDTVSIGDGTANREAKSITVTSATQFTVSALANAHADNELVLTLTDGRYRMTTSTGAGTINDAHHLQEQCVFNDQLVSAAMRSAYGSAYLAAYNHVLVRTAYRVTDATLIEEILTAGVQPGDTIKATSDDPDLGLVYSNTTVTVQDLVVTIGDGVCQQIDLVLGDPALDDLAVLERRLAAAQAAATAVFA